MSAASERRARARRRRETILAAEAMLAAARGRIGSDGSRWGSANGKRSMITADPRSRQRCQCGCRTRSTHVGLGDGVALTGGCELYVRRWVRNGYSR